MKHPQKLETLEDFKAYLPTAVERRTAQRRFAEPANTFTDKQRIVMLGLFADRGGHHD